jgi:hypothetical protein
MIINQEAARQRVWEGQKKKKPEEMTELERLRYENERLRAENALIKKVRALESWEARHTRG